MSKMLFQPIFIKKLPYPRFLANNFLSLQRWCDPDAAWGRSRDFFWSTIGDKAVFYIKMSWSKVVFESTIFICKWVQIRKNVKWERGHYSPPRFTDYFSQRWPPPQSTGGYFMPVSCLNVANINFRKSQAKSACFFCKFWMPAILNLGWVGWVDGGRVT